MATPVHYIRTIHTSFTAAHPHSSYASNMPLALAYPASRKRSASVRSAPPAYSQRRVKFDPFADDADSIPSASAVLTRPQSIPYTIHIPPAAPADIQRHHHHHQPRHYRQQFQQHPPRVSTPRPPPMQRVSASPVATMLPPNPAKEREARSKIVAGILLNRVHAVGKPMRRRVADQPKAYVPSSLSTCIALQA